MRSFSSARTSGSRYMRAGIVDARATSSCSRDMRQHCRSVAPTLAIVNGRVWSRPGATEIGIQGDRIATVGHGQGDFGAGRVIDAGGAWILPAFNDAHVHFLMASRALDGLDLFGAGTQAEVERRIGEY